MELSCGVLLVGVSQYGGNDEYTDLPFCERDVDAVNYALTRNLGVTADNVMSLTGHVSRKEFQQKVADMCDSGFGRVVLYFSGHGEVEGIHFLRFSDNRAVSTSEAIRQLETSCESLIVILDCCFSGRAAEGRANDDRAASTVDCGSGTLIVSSSTSRERSYPTSTGDMSVFTRCFCTALNIHGSRTGPTISFVDVLNSCQRLVDRYNEYAPRWNQQQMFLKDDSSGPILFANPHCSPTKAGSTSDSTLRVGDLPYLLEPIHSSMYRRYRIVVILGETDLPTVVASIRKVIQDVRSRELSQTIACNNRRDAKPLQRIVGFVYPSEDECIHHNHEYLFDWCIPIGDVVTMVPDRNLVFSAGNLKIGRNPSYEFISEHIDRNRMTDEEIWMKVAGFLDHLDTLWRRAMNPVNRFLSKQSSREELWDSIRPYGEEIKSVADSALDTGFSNSALIEELVNSAIGLAGTVCDIRLLCLPECDNGRPDKNLRECLMDLRSRYSQDYERTWTALKRCDPLSC